MNTTENSDIDLSDDQLLRYSRQIMLPSVDLAGQARLLNSRVLILGLGGLGAPVAMYLAASGIGHLVLVDYDDVELSNLQRQIIHETQSIGKPKVQSAKACLDRINPEISSTLIGHKLTEPELTDQVELADVVVDGTDNFESRFLINKVCVKTRTPLVSGAVIRMEGQVSTYVPGDTNCCYRCLYPEGEQEMETCSENGVLAPVAGIIGSIQATEAIKVLLGLEGILLNRLLLLDAATMEWRAIKMKKDPACPVCAVTSAVSEK